MPWKTHKEMCRAAASLLICFELGGRHVAESRVQPFLVVDLFQVLADGGASMGQIAIIEKRFINIDDLPTNERILLT